MSRPFPWLAVAIATAAAVLTGCRPEQPKYLSGDGDLSHYKGVAQEMVNPDIEQQPLHEVTDSLAPLSLDNKDCKEAWDLKLEEAIQLALANNKVMRSIGGQIGGPPDFINRNPELVPTIYDPAIMESDPRGGVEAALSAFDAQFNFINRWDKTDQPVNTQTSIASQNVFVNLNKQDQGTMQAQLSKVNATGGKTSLSHSWLYLDSNNPLRIYPADWTTLVRAEVRQPLLQGYGVQFNRIAGPGATPGLYNGVMIARINVDIRLCDFQMAVRTLVSDVEIAYWELYYNYRNLDAVIAGRDAGLQTWRQVNEKFRVGAAPIHEEAQARSQYFLFRASVERALTALYQAESKLRYLMGLATTDGRLIRPADEPTTAKVCFDWQESLNEAIARSTELREWRWIVKRRELELIASKNFLLPKLDFVGAYQWQGLGEVLTGNGRSSVWTDPGSTSYGSLLGGNFANWSMGLEMSMPLGFRREMSGVRSAELSLIRDRVRLQEAELEISHQLAYAIRDLDSNQNLAQTIFNRRVAARDEVRAAVAKYEAQVKDGTLTNVLDAQRRLAEAESDYYRTLVDYNKAIAQVHLRKGTLLDYNGVFLAEGPWPAKAYFDATRRARARDAGTHLDYGFTYPKVVSQGPIQQTPGDNSGISGAHGQPTPAIPPEANQTGPNGKLEPIPAPKGEVKESDMPAPPKAVPEPDAFLRKAAKSDAGAPGAGKSGAGKTSARIRVARSAEGWKSIDGAQRSGKGLDVSSLDLNDLTSRAKSSEEETPAVRPAGFSDTPVGAKSSVGWKKVQ